MIRSFLDANFLLRTDTAVELYRRHAEKLPVADYHTRLRADLIAANQPVADLTTLWLDTDPDKWRLMRAGGVSEDYISGNRTPYEKFEKWAEILPQAMRHPIYHQAHMELNRVFGISETLKPSNARDIYESCTAKPRRPSTCRRPSSDAYASRRWLRRTIPPTASRPTLRCVRLAEWMLSASSPLGRPTVCSTSTTRSITTSTLTNWPPHLTP